MLEALGIPWHQGLAHIRCPYPAHGGNGDWRWDDAKKKAFCTCSKGDSIFNVVMRCEGLGFEAAKIWTANLLGRQDLIKQRGSQERQAFIRMDAKSLLNPPADLRDDLLPRSYFAHRLGVEPGDVMMPDTRTVGISSLGYFDPPPSSGGSLS